MDIEEYQKEVERIDEQAVTARRILAGRYAMERNKVTVGDIVKDSFCSIRVDTISFGTSFGIDLPECVYIGPRLTKKGDPYKDGDRRRVWKSAMKDEHS